MRLRWLMVLAVAALAGGGCGAPKYEITHVGPSGPPLGPGCPLAESPGGPGMPVEDIAVIKVRCAAGQCMNQLRDVACDLGADVLHSVITIRAGAYMQGTAARAVRAQVVQPPAGGTQGGEAPPPPAGY